LKKRCERGWVHACRASCALQQPPPPLRPSQQHSTNAPLHLHTTTTTTTNTNAPHQHPQVSEIVDRAQKEEKMEAGLAKLQDTWGRVAFSFVPHKEGSDVALVKMAEEDFEVGACVWGCFGCWGLGGEGLGRERSRLQRLLRMFLQASAATVRVCSCSPCCAKHPPNPTPHPQTPDA